MAAPAIVDVSEETPRVSWRQWGMVAALTLLLIYAQIDGLSLFIMVEPIKRDLGVSDTALSLLLGLSFATFHGVLGLPAGYLVDRYSRRAIMGVGVVLWSTMTVTCGLARTYAQLFLGRCGLGIGEAAITPASYSLIRDAFPSEKRGRAFGMFASGNYIGPAIGFMLTGALLGVFGSGRFTAIPFIGGLHPWQAVFVTLGTVGIPLSLLVLTFREPPREATRSRDGGVHFSEAFSHVRSVLAPYTALIVFVTCFSGVSLTYAAWMPAVIGRTWNLAPQQIGIVFGILLLVCGPVGAWCSGYVIDLLTRRGRRDAAELVGVWATLIYLPFGVVTPIVPRVGEMWLGLAAQLLVAGAFNPVGASILARITPQRLMGKVTAIYLLIYTLLARGLGPLLVALMSDHLFSGPQALGYALGFGTLLAMAGALAAIWWLYAARKQGHAIRSLQ